MSLEVTFTREVLREERTASREYVPGTVLRVRDVVLQLFGVVAQHITATLGCIRDSLTELTVIHQSDVCVMINMSC